MSCAVCRRERKTPSQRLHSSSAAEETGHWSREEDALHGMADIIRELWEENVDRSLSLEHIDVYLLSGGAGALSEDRGDVPVLLQAGPARSGTGHSGGGPGGRQRGTDPRQEGGRVILLWRIWLVLCVGQVSAATFTLIPEEEYWFFIASRRVSLFVNNPSGVVLKMQNIKNDLLRHQWATCRTNMCLLNPTVAKGWKIFRPRIRFLEVQCVVCVDRWILPWHCFSDAVTLE